MSTSAALPQAAPTMGEFVSGYVDGSFWEEKESGGKRRIGAGVYFGDGDPDNRCVPVPCSSKYPADSLRAELYAALLFVYLACQRKHKSNLCIFQDSVIAVHLLNSCKYGSCLELSKLCPSRWATEGRGETLGADGQKYRFGIDYVWGESVDSKKIERYGDVLDVWWVFTRGISVVVKWVQAHRSEPIDRSSHDWLHWKGNQRADTLAKLGARTDRSDRELLSEFAPYPLFRTDPTFNLPPKPDPKLYYLPLFQTPQTSRFSHCYSQANKPIFDLAQIDTADPFGPSLFPPAPSNIKKPMPQPTTRDIQGAPTRGKTECRERA